MVLKEQLTGININKKTTERLNQYLDDLNGQSFQGVNTLSALSFENEAQQTSYKRYYLPSVEIKYL